MPNTSLDNIHDSQKKRLAHIDFRLNYLGSLSRRDLMSRFGVKDAAATRDIALYKENAEKNIVYNEKIKVYERGDNFQAIFECTADQILTALSKGFGEDLVGTHKALITCEAPAQLNTPTLEVISVVSRAIHQKKCVKITYRSLSSGQTEREIIPFALVDNGLRWHVRAFDRKRSRFTDFVLTRITTPSILNCDVQESETRDFDIQWNRIVEMEITAHPRLTYPETIEQDYNMKDGVLHVNVRAAVAGYVLRRWNVDCSEDHSLEGYEFYLWLKNVKALYGVENLIIAPGYKEH